MRHAIFATALLFTVPALAEEAAVQSPLPQAADPAADADVGFRGCGSHAAVGRWLKKSFAETPFVRGLQGDGRMFELYMAKQGSTWTAVVTDPAGQSCIVTEGTSMDVLPQATGPVA